MPKFNITLSKPDLSCLALSVRLGGMKCRREGVLTTADQCRRLADSLSDALRLNGSWPRALEINGAERRILMAAIDLDLIAISRKGQEATVRQLRDLRARLAALA